MPTYLQLQSEPWWGAQFTPPVMTAELLDPLRGHFGLGPVAIGAAGDNNHLYGRHRSRNWDLNSRYCTNRAYGTRDARDLQGDGDWYRAFDVGIRGQALYDASRRMDALARSGACPGLAEWFGTFDGNVVVGWYEGHPSSSDDSHLYHLHGGVWTQYANDPTTMRQLYAAVTGEDDDMTPEEYKALLTTARLAEAKAQNASAIAFALGAGEDSTDQCVVAFGEELGQPLGVVDLKPYWARVGKGGGGGLTEQQVEDAAFRGAQRAEDQ